MVDHGVLVGMEHLCSTTLTGLTPNLHAEAEWVSTKTAVVYGVL